MRIAFVSQYPATPEHVVGGVQAVVRQLATEMARRGDLDVHAVSVEHGRSSPDDERLEGVHVHRLPGTPRFGNVTLGRFERRATAGVLRNIAPDIVHAHVLGPAAMAAADSGLPWVATAHGMQAAEGSTLRGLVNRVRTRSSVVMERRSLRSLRHLIVISPYVLDYIGARGAHLRTHAIENPVEERFFARAEPGDPRVVFFSGRLIPRKDVETLLTAMGLLAGRGVGLTLRVAGGADTPAYESALRERAVAEGVAESVEFLGALPPEGVLRELRSAGIYVQSSRQETASLSLMEAMAVGRPVVATDVGGTRHLVDPGVSGLLTPGADPRALASALQRYGSDPDAARAAGEAGKRIARARFRIGAIVDRTLAVYRAALVRDSGITTLQSAGSDRRN